MLRCCALLLALAYLPSLSFVDHWREFGGHEAALAGGDAHDAAGHEAHCHAGAASCSDAPATAGDSVAVLRDIVSDVTAAGQETEVPALASRIPDGFGRAPEYPPPRL